MENNKIFYTKSHEWIKFTDDDIALIGITDYAQNALGDIVFITLPSEGDIITAGESFGDIESVKAVSEIFSPVSASVTKVNEDVFDNPEIINSDAFGTWLLEVSDITDKSEFLNAEEYEAFCASEE